MAVASVAKALVFLAKHVALAFAVPSVARENGLADVDVDGRNDPSEGRGTD